MTERNGTLDPRVRTEAERLAVQLVHGGFTDFDDAVEAVVETFFDDGFDDSFDDSFDDGFDYGDVDGGGAGDAIPAGGLSGGSGAGADAVAGWIGGGASGGGGGVTYEQAAEIVASVWTARLTEQTEWPEMTDADRVLAAFDALVDQGIVAEPHFACCRTCGLSEIGGQATARSRGFVFFHQQDTAAAATGDGLMLAYGGFGGSVDETTAVGREVTAALRAAGLSVDWNGSPERRIHVTPLDWRIRLPAMAE